LFQPQFDIVAGNPPWINWESLPDDYRTSLIPLNQERYKLFLATGNEARHGQTKIDLSQLMFYVACDSYLKKGGKLGFVITQTLFKSQGSAGFRRFEIEKSGPLKVLQVEDLSDIQCFEGATNRTAILLVEKGRPTEYPVQYYYWQKAEEGVRIATDAPHDEVLTLVASATARGLPYLCGFGGGGGGWYDEFWIAVGAVLR
jgi:hypothetical protein